MPDDAFALNELDDERIKTDIQMEIANTIVGEVTDLLALADRRLTWIGLHGGETASDAGLIQWPTAAYGIEPTAKSLETVLRQWSREATELVQGPLMVESLQRLMHTLAMYRDATHEGDRAYFAYAAGHAREEAADGIAALVSELRKAMEA